MALPAVPEMLKIVTIYNGCVVDDEDIVVVEPLLNETIYFVAWHLQFSPGPNTARPKRRLSAVSAEPARVWNHHHLTVGSFTPLPMKVEDVLLEVEDESSVASALVGFGVSADSSAHPTVVLEGTLGNYCRKFDFRFFDLMHTTNAVGASLEGEVNVILAGRPYIVHYTACALDTDYYVFPI